MRWLFTAGFLLAIASAASGKNRDHPNWAFLWPAVGLLMASLALYLIGLFVGPGNRY